MKSNIALIGMSGTFKSTVARKLASKVHKMSLDCDQLIEFEYGMPISQIFEKMGEQYFRKIEKKQIFDISDFTNTVVATGGGIVLDSENMEVLKSSAYVICLNANAKNIYSRLKNDTTRPLLSPMTQEAVENYVKARQDKYAQWADFCVNTNGKSSDKVVDLICEHLKLNYFK